MSKSISSEKPFRVKIRFTKSHCIKRPQCENEILPHLKGLQQSARKLTSNKMDAQDLVQDTLLKAIRCWDSYKVGSNCGAWLHRILRNTFISEHRARLRRPMVINLDDLHDTDLLDLSACGQVAPTPEDLFQSSRMKAAVAAGLARLRGEFRQPLRLYFWSGLSYRDIAIAVNLPVTTVRARIYRSKQMMRDLLGC